MKLLLIALALSAAYAVQFQVTLNVFSGTQDPQWTVTGVEALQLQQLLIKERTPAETSRPIPAYRMGYSGFSLTDDAGHKFAVYNSPAAESSLLRQAVARQLVPRAVEQHVQSEVARVQALHLNQAPPHAELTSNAVCNPPPAVRGPDNGTVYDPKNDANGCFVTAQTMNNCYNYGCDVATNTFAQPGRGTGHKWEANTCDAMREAATRDGLVWTGTTLPTHQPAVGHNVALLIWPDTNFHWIRMDSVPAGYWSHKAGQTPVRNTDNNGQKITDPSKADFSPWTEFCGYMTAVPSQVTIN